MMKWKMSKSRRKRKKIMKMKKMMVWRRGYEGERERDSSVPH